MNSQFKTYKKVLSIAGSDSGGGAGIQADLKTISALRCYGMTAITSLTAQNTQGVSKVFPLPASFVSDQIRSVIEDIGVDAIKIGMLHSLQVIEEVSKTLRDYKIKNIVLDPVMVSQNGDKLIENDAIQAIANLLFPLSKIMTPNLHEAEAFLSRQGIDSQSEMEKASKELLKKSLGSALLLKGGHLTSQKGHDLLHMKEKFYWFESPEVKTKNTHGTGCTLSSAIACHLAHDYDLIESIKLSKKYIESALIEGKVYSIGKGHGPPHHFFKYW